MPSSPRTGAAERRGDQILRHRILCLTTDPAMRRALKRLMTAVGALTEFIADPSQVATASEDGPPSLVCIDLRAPELTLASVEAVFPEKRLICIVGGQDFAQISACLSLPRCGSVITYDDKFEPEDFIITVTKLLHGQIFGVQKYFPWGVTLYNMEIASYDDKIKALDVLCAYAELAGARGPVRDRMALVAEELIINAMYHAPVDDEGKPLFRHLPRKELTHIDFERRVKVSCASNGQHFAIAVRDQYGSLDKDTVVKFLSKGALAILEPENRDSGAGLGLVSALKTANQLIFNLAPAIGTEVIAVFDLDLMHQGHAGVRSVHVFTDRRRPPPPDPEPPRIPMAPMVAGALAVILIIFGIVGVVRKIQEGPPTMVSAEVPLLDRDGKTEEVPIKVGNTDLKLRLERKGSRVVISSH